MFRAALLSIVLTLAAGQDAALLCSVWCHTTERLAGACEHQPEATVPGVVPSDVCAINGNPIVFVGEDGRRNTSPPDVGGAVVVTFGFLPATGDTPSAYDPNSRPLLERRPLVLALRI